MEDYVLSQSELSSVVTGAADLAALEKVTGGKAYCVGRIYERNAVILDVNGRCFVYARVQEQGQTRSSAYNTQTLKNKLSPNMKHDDQQFDHVASAGVEGGRIGNRLVLMAFVDRVVNQGHGGMYERGPVPIREFAAAASPSPDKASLIDKQMADKLAQMKPDGDRRTKDVGVRSYDERKRISDALMLDPKSQAHLKKLVQERKQLAPAPKQVRPVAKAPAPRPSPAPAPAPSRAPSPSAPAPTQVAQPVKRPPQPAPQVQTRSTSTRGR